MPKISAAGPRPLPPVLATLVTLMAVPAHAADFYVDPSQGASGNDGSQAHPWQTLEAVIAAGHFGSKIVAGDQVWLRSGYHGAFVLRGGSYATPVRVTAVSGETPQLSHVSLSQTNGWVLSGLTISPSYDGSLEPLDMVLIDKSSTEVVVENCRLFSSEDTSGWSAQDWVNLPSSGVSVRGENVTIRGNSIHNVRFGISVDGRNALIQSNQIVNFSADGIRGLGDNGVFEYNLVKNVYVDDAAGDSNHDDGFQSWSVGPDGPGDGVVKGVVLRGNVFINREDPNQRFPNAMQGIGCFDGFFEDWVVENNLVVTDHWHGISFYGMRNSRIVNNTVLDINAVKPGPPWIMVTAHKDGTPSENVIVRNNLATDFTLEGTTITDDQNSEIADPSKHFVNAGSFDFHLLASSAAIDVGSAELAPALDADRIVRPQGKGVDLGAFEWHDGGVQPSTGAQTGGAPALGTTTLAARGGGANAAATGSSGGVANGSTSWPSGFAGESNAAQSPARESGCDCRLSESKPVAQTAASVLWCAVQILRRRARRKQWAGVAT